MSPGEPLPAAARDDPRPPASLLALALVGLAGGGLSGLLGVGGGLVIVPLLVLRLGRDQRTAHAISLAAIVPISAAGIVSYAVAGDVRWAAAAARLAGSRVGARLGALALVRVRERPLQIAFGVLCVAIAVAVAVGG